MRNLPERLPSLEQIRAERGRRHRMVTFRDYPKVLRMLDLSDGARRSGKQQEAYTAERIAGGCLRVALMERGSDWIKTPEWTAWCERKSMTRPEVTSGPDSATAVVISTLATARQKGGLWQMIHSRSL
jgi:hypothetical protein